MALLARLMRICDSARRSVRTMTSCVEGVDQNSRPLPSASGRSAVGHLLDDLLADDRLELELHLPRFDLGQVQQVVDEREQVLAADVCTVPQLLLLLGGERAGQPHQQRAGEADDGVERRAQLMAHAGQEPVLGRVARSPARGSSPAGSARSACARSRRGRRRRRLAACCPVIEGRGVVGHDRFVAVAAAGGQLVVGHLALVQHQPDAVLGLRRIGEVILERRSRSARPAGQPVSASICWLTSVMMPMGSVVMSASMLDSMSDRV